MRHQYNKPRIEINYWIVNSKNIKKLYNSFKKRFPKSVINLNLETESGHNRIYETFEEYLEDISKIIEECEKVSKISILGSERKNMDIYKQAWISINFGKYCHARIHVVGGDTDGSHKDWIEGAYIELKKLKKIFEITDKKTIKILDKDYDKIVFDPNEEIKDKIQDTLTPRQDKNGNKVTVVVNKEKSPILNIVFKYLISGLIMLLVGWLIYYFGWN